MNVYIGNIQHVVRAYGRQMGRRLVLGRPKDPQDKVTISEEGKRRLLEDITKRLQQKHSEMTDVKKDKKIVFKTVNSEGEEITEEMSLEKQSQLLEKFVEKFLKEKGLGHENR